MSVILPFSSRGSSALSRLMTKSGCSPKIFLKVKSAFGSKYFAIFTSFFADTAYLRQNYEKSSAGQKKMFLFSLLGGKQRGTEGNREVKIGKIDKADKAEIIEKIQHRGSETRRHTEILSFEGKERMERKKESQGKRR